MSRPNAHEIDDQKIRLYQIYDRKHLIEKRRKYELLTTEERIEYIRERRKSVEKGLRDYIYGKEKNRTD